MPLFACPSKEKRSHLFEKLGQEHSERWGKGLRKRRKANNGAITSWLPPGMSGTQPCSEMCGLPDTVMSFFQSSTVSCRDLQNDFFPNPSSCPFEENRNNYKILKYIMMYVPYVYMG